MAKAPRINPAAIELMARYFNSHKKGIPEWLKNSREAYAPLGWPRERRNIIVHYQPSHRSGPGYLECIDFVGISGQDIEDCYLEWAKPNAAPVGLRPEDRESGQGNGGKAYLRQLFSQGFFISIFNRKLSIVSFTDKDKYVLDFVPDVSSGKDTESDNRLLPDIRKYAAAWDPSRVLWKKKNGVTSC